MRKEPGEQRPAVLLHSDRSAFVMPEVGSQGVGEQGAAARCGRDASACLRVQARSVQLRAGPGSSASPSQKTAR